MGTGLKYIEIEGKYKKMLIVPFTGTGIKARRHDKTIFVEGTSYPSRVRGLKNGGRKDEQRRI